MTKSEGTFSPISECRWNLKERYFATVFRGTFWKYELEIQRTKRNKIDIVKVFIIRLTNKIEKDYKSILLADYTGSFLTLKVEGNLYGSSSH